MSYTVIMPVKASDVHLVHTNYRRIKKYVGAKKIIIITNISACMDLSGFDKDVEFIDEDSLYEGLTFNAVKVYMVEKGLDPKQTGHCFQQLLKMAFAFQCNDEGYLVWDADTIPTKEVLFYDKDTQKYIFYMKNEYVSTYFRHLDKILGIEKQTKKSFISEHMYFEREVMKEIIDKIGENPRSEGTTWWEKIVKAMETGNGMSEYEIYGNYVLKYYPNKYKMENCISLRYGRNVLGNSPTEEQLDWMGKYYDSVSIEQFDKETFITQFSKNKWIQCMFAPKSYASVISFINRGINKIRRIEKNR